MTRNGYYGGVRLLWAICAEVRPSRSLTPRIRALTRPRLTTKFYKHWAATQTPLPARGFRLSYETTIPRQAGLSGSSAIVTAALSCLEAHFGAAFALPKATRPALVLAAERALGITAGLQDRVVQTYEGVVYMDFDAEGMSARGHGEYTPLDPDTLPPLWCVPCLRCFVFIFYSGFDDLSLGCVNRLVWCDNPGDSGAVHSTVRARWDAGDDTTRQLMAQVAALAPAGRAALAARDVAALAALMDTNFELRRGLFGDAALGARNVAMVRTAQRCGASAKFCGSGGAAVALCPAGEEQEAQLARDCAAAGLRCERVRVRRPE